MEVTLSAGELMTMEVPFAPCRMVCRTGKLWVTLTGDVRDYMLAAGCSHEFPQGGVLVVEALSDAALVLQPSTSPARQAGTLRMALAAH